MPKPDVEMVHDETGHIYFQGKVYDVTRMASGWVITRPCQFDRLYEGGTVEDCCAWLMAQQTA